MRDAFNYLDTLSIGHISAESLKKVLAENKCYPSDEEIRRLVTRFDKNGNGRINYQEWMDEIMPKNSITL